MLFRDALRRAGVAVTGAAVAGRPATQDAMLARHLSAPLQHLLRAVNGESDNFSAEMLLKHLGAVDRGKGTTGAGATVVNETLRDAGISLAGVRVVDALRPVAARPPDGRRARRHPRPRVGRPAPARVVPRPRWPSPGAAGRSRTGSGAPPTAGNVWAKTGTTSRASALAGYVAGRYAFAVIQNGSPISSWWARRAQDRFVTVLAS